VKSDLYAGYAPSANSLPPPPGIPNRDVVSTARSRKATAAYSNVALVFAGLAVGFLFVELGYRLASRGALIRLDPNLQVKHLKHWTLPLLVRTDIGLRAFPWATLLIEYGYLPERLNFGNDQRVGAFLSMVLMVLGVMTLFRPAAAVPFALCLALAGFANQGLYRLFYRKGGARLLIGGFLLQNFYYLYSAWALAVGIAFVALKRLFTDAG
jgi:hypothetical protein